MRTNYTSESSFSPIPGDRDSISDSTKSSKPTHAKMVAVCEAPVGPTVSKMAVQCSESLGREQVSTRTEHSGTAEEEPSHRTAGDCPSQQSPNYDMEDSEMSLSVEAATIVPSIEAATVEPSSEETKTTKPSSTNAVAALRPQQFDRTCTDVRERDSVDSQKPEMKCVQETLTDVSNCDQEICSVLPGTKTSDATREESSCITSALTAEPSAVEATGTSIERENETFSAEESKRQVAVKESPLVQGAIESGNSHTSEFPQQPPGGMVEMDPDCTECALVRADPAPHELVMYLHALSYQVSTILTTLLFQTPLMH